MKIVRLEAEQFKRLRAVSITPDGNIVRVGGKNGAGKSSVLDAMFAALAGASAAPPKPVRQGEERATIRLDLGDLTITRTFDADGATSLRVESAEGAAFQSPQGMLDKLIGAIAFDPLEFARMKAPEQSAALRALVPLDIDLDALAAANADDYAKRTDANRDAKRFDAQMARYADLPPLPDGGVPDAGALRAELAAAHEHNTTVQGRVVALRLANDRTLGLRDEIAEAEDDLAELRNRFTIEMAKRDALPDPGDPIDTDGLDERVGAALALRIVASDHEAREAMTREIQRAREKSAAYTKAMADRDRQRDEALAAADMPLDGLSFTTDGVTFQDLPFEQASDAERLRISTAIAMAANPQLRVLRIKDGSLLDADGLRLIGEMASEGDFQIWLEAVGEGDGTTVGIVMEDGAVRGAPEPEPMTAGPKRRRKTKK